MYDYNASYLNEQATLLEEFHKIQKYLNEHPLYQIYQSSADYVAGVNEYYINEVSVRAGSTLGVGDVVLFSNVYYGVITEINEETQMFTIAQGISFRGETGETGPRGGIGPRGLPGEDGNNALEYLGAVIQIQYDGDEFNEPHTFNNSDFNRTPVVGDGFLFMYHLNESNLSYIVNGRVTAVGTDTCQVTILPEARQEVTGPAGQTGATGATGKEGLSIYLYNGELSSSVTSVTLSQINIPTGRTLAVGDILFSSLASTYGAMSIVTDTTGTVDFIGTLTGGGGSGGVSDVQINGASIVADGVANIPYATDTQEGVINTSSQNINGNKIFQNTLNFPSVSFVGNDNGVLRGQSNLIVNKRSSYLYSILQTTNHYIVLGGKRSNDSYKGLWIDVMNGRIAMDCLFTTSRYSPSWWSTLPDYRGTLLSAPSTWSTGTSGSVTLPSAGLYEVKVTLNTCVYNFIVNWDGANITVSMGSLNADGNAIYRIAINAAGLMTVQKVEIATATKTALTDTISYRKIGIA